MQFILEIYAYRLQTKIRIIIKRTYRPSFLHSSFTVFVIAEILLSLTKPAITYSKLTIETLG